MLWRRLVGAAMLVPPILMLFWCEEHLSRGWPGIFLVPLALLAAAAAASEIVAWLRHAQLPVLSGVAVLGGPFVLLATYLAALQERTLAGGTLGGTLALVAVMIISFLGCMIHYERPARWFTTLAHTLFIVAYVALPLGFLILLRLLEPDRRGLLALFSVLWIVKLSDVGAYFAGKSLGKTPLAPRLSPAKTVAGAVGGLLAGCLAGLFSQLVLGRWLLPQAPAPHWLAVIGFGLSVTLAGMVGDLAESLLKRDLELKDSGAWIPGLGGAMDVLDSVLLAAPIGFFWWYLGWI